MIRKAINKDIPSILELLKQVCGVHHVGRPDLFKGEGAVKYTAEELALLLQDQTSPVFVYTDKKDEVLGYAFCKLICYAEHNIFTDVKTLYIDDLCVDENCRGQGIGRALYEFVLGYAKQNSCYNVTLNVWACNESALSFYEKLGLKKQKIGMEVLL